MSRNLIRGDHATTEQFKYGSTDSSVGYNRFDNTNDHLRDCTCSRCASLRLSSDQPVDVINPSYHDRGGSGGGNLYSPPTLEYSGLSPPRSSTGAGDQSLSGHDRPSGYASAGSYGSIPPDLYGTRKDRSSYLGSHLPSPKPVVSYGEHLISQPQETYRPESAPDRYGRSPPIQNEQRGTRESVLSYKQSESYASRSEYPSQPNYHDARSPGNQSAYDRVPPKPDVGRQDKPYETPNVAQGPSLSGYADVQSISAVVSSSNPTFDIWARGKHPRGCSCPRCSGRRRDEGINFTEDGCVFDNSIKYPHNSVSTYRAYMDTPRRPTIGDRGSAGSEQHREPEPMALSTSGDHAYGYSTVRQSPISGAGSYRPELAGTRQEFRETTSRLDPSFARPDPPVARRYTESRTSRGPPYGQSAVPNLREESARNVSRKNTESQRDSQQNHPYYEERDQDSTFSDQSSDYGTPSEMSASFTNDRSPSAGPSSRGYRSPQNLSNPLQKPSWQTSQAQTAGTERELDDLDRHDDTYIAVADHGSSESGDEGVTLID